MVVGKATSWKLAPKKASVPIPMMESISRMHSTLRWLYVVASKAKAASMTKVAMLSICANAHEDTVLTSMIQTMKSSLMSRCTVKSRLAPNSSMSSGMNLRNSSHRC